MVYKSSISALLTNILSHAFTKAVLLALLPILLISFCRLCNCVVVVDFEVSRHVYGIV